MRPSGRPRGSVPGRMKVTTLNLMTAYRAKVSLSRQSSSLRWRVARATMQHICRGGQQPIAPTSGNSFAGRPGLLLACGRTRPAGSSREAPEIEHAKDAQHRRERGKSGGQQDGYGWAGTPRWSGKAEDQGDESGADGLAQQSRGRLNGAGAAAALARRAGDDRAVVR